MDRWFDLGCHPRVVFKAEATPQGDKPIRVAVVGLVHGHVKGFFAALPKNEAATLVAIVEPQQELARPYAAEYKLDGKLFYTDLEKMLEERKPDAVLVYADDCGTFSSVITG